MSFVNVNLKPNKSLYQNLLKIYGLNSKSVSKLCNFLGLNANNLLQTFTNEQLKVLEKVIEMNYKSGLKLKDSVNFSLQSLFLIRHYRGVRYKNKLPVNGQNTRNNAKTVKNFGKTRKKRKEPLNNRK